MSYYTQCFSMYGYDDGICDEMEMPKDSVPVMVNVYDIRDNSSWDRLLSLGVYHAAIEVHGIEYSFGGHMYSSSGVYTSRPRHQLNNSFVYKLSEKLGYTRMSCERVRDIAFELGNTKFRGCDYNLLQNNCNHFADALAKILCTKPLPSWINRTANSASILGLSKVLPQRWVQPQLTSYMSDQSITTDLVPQQKMTNVDDENGPILDECIDSCGRYNQNGNNNINDDFDEIEKNSQNNTVAIFEESLNSLSSGFNRLKVKLSEFDLTKCLSNITSTEDGGTLTDEYDNISDIDDIEYENSENMKKLATKSNQNGLLGQKMGKEKGLHDGPIIS
ncbi:hypothetical protein SNEBB_002783 [Seison nebaliae]|nr:hypothetical protein SNEBB_002783 [Seison nebaliae]